ncbi:MAG TPA: phospholipid carrier-dependent glycosyltransferase, partial [Dehalococcoidia bacterium]|nr:phospholipid carrier-dependent glycosyltransferase [Dehalococcoidia bacterium]
MQLPIGIRNSIDIEEIELRLPRITWAVALSCLVAIAAGISFGYNLFGFPSYFQDEGVYVSQAYSVMNDAKLAPYTFWYDHPPAAWIFIGIWMKLTGGFFTFGNSLDTGRIFVLALHLSSVLMLFWLTLRISGSRIAGMLASLMFAFSPYWLVQGRQLMLEPIAVFWLLAAMIPLFFGRTSVASHAFSGACFAIAVLSKEVFVAFIPGVLLLAWLTAEQELRVMASAVWAAVSTSVTSIYVLYAVLKGELLPEGWPLAAGGEHVSLIGTLQFHMNREKDAGLLDMDSRFWSNSVVHWFDLDPFLTAAAPLAVLACVILGFRRRIFWAFGLMILSFILFLSRGGVVFDFYALPLVPLIALVIAIAGVEVIKGVAGLLKGRELNSGLSLLGRRLPATALKLTWAGLYLFLALGLTSVATVGALNHDSYQRWYKTAFTTDNTSPQRQAVAWVRENVPRDSFVMFNGYALLELPGDFPLAHWYWKVERDPEIRDDLLHKNWRGVDYAIVTPNMEEEARSGVIPSVATIMSHGE